MGSGKEFFNSGGHLTEESIAMWVDAIRDNAISGLPEPVSSHGEVCLSCKEKVLEIVQVTESASENMQPGSAFIRSRKHLFPVTPVYKIAAVATILIIMGVMLFYLLTRQKKDPAQIFASHFEPYADLISTKNGNKDTVTYRQLLLGALSLYNDTKFDSSRLIFAYIDKVYPGNDTVAFYLANSILASKENPADAIAILDALLARNQSFINPSKWYLALALLKNGETGKAKKILTEIGLRKDFYQVKAMSLLHELK